MDITVHHLEWFRGDLKLQESVEKKTLSDETGFTPSPQNSLKMLKPPEVVAESGTAAWGTVMNERHERAACMFLRGRF